MNIFNQPPLSSVVKLLVDADLPIDDIDGVDLNHFFGIGSEQELLGIVGLELFDSVALLRSLVVLERARGTGCGKKLVDHIEQYAKDNGVKSLYLLTTTAEAFFNSLGYTNTERSAAPEAIVQTQEFSGICPGSAAFMVKHLSQ